MHKLQLHRIPQPRRNSNNTATAASYSNNAQKLTQKKKNTNHSAIIDARKIYSIVLYGGERRATQADQINKQVDIISGTPGRVRDFVDDGIISFASLETLIFDEADQLVDLGLESFVRDIVENRDMVLQTTCISAFEFLMMMMKMMIFASAWRIRSCGWCGVGDLCLASSGK